MRLIAILRRRATTAIAAVATAGLLVAFITVVANPSANAADTPTAPVAAADDRALGAVHGGDHGNLPAPKNPAEVAFHDQMRKLWEDHVTWTRLAIVTFADGSAGFGATATRLLQNQTDIGNAFQPFYGTANGNQLASLLHDHITIAVEILQAAKAGDTAAFNDASTRWYANANDIADFLSSHNPHFWPDATMRAAMKTHLDQTLAEASDELGGNFAASVTDYEAIHLHILDMADLLSAGIIGQFPKKFH
jgi:hypothetical protein